MSKIWDELEIQAYITNFIEESLTLDYKAADSLGRSDGKKTEITKDVSAMANSTGGLIIYGLREYNDPTKKHLAERLDAVDRTQFSKEWLEQIINNIRPHITGVIIHPVSLTSGPNDVAYVVEIPQSNKGHQANDFKYYKRFNFQSVPMADYEIRDVMNRATIPDAMAEFQFQTLLRMQHKHEYELITIVKNLGEQVINHFKLVFKFPRIAAPSRLLGHPRENIIVTFAKDKDYLISYQSKGVLFPKEERNIGEEILWRYEVDSEIYSELRSLEGRGRESQVEWTLYADNMTPKQGKVAFKTLHGY